RRCRGIRRPRPPAHDAADRRRVRDQHAGARRGAARRRRRGRRRQRGARCGFGGCAGSPAGGAPRLRVLARDRGTRLMPVRGIRGATTVARNDARAIYDATFELLGTIVKLNGVRAEDVGYIWFTVTDDLNASFPADAARAGLGWADVPLICGREIPVPGALERCVRVLLAWNTPKTQKEVRHDFLPGARVLRPACAVDLPGARP